MFRQVNVNPLGKSIGDCSTRAIAVLFYNGDWYRAYIEKCIIGLLQANESTANEVIDVLMKNKGYKKALLPDDCPNCTTFGMFSEMYPTGKYLLCTGSHVCACIDGCIVDSWDSSDEVVSYYYYHV